MMTDKEYDTQTYTTYSGAEMVVLANGVPVGTLDGITWNITRPPAPIYTPPDGPRSFGPCRKRGISGSLMFDVIDQDALPKSEDGYIQPFNVVISFSNTYGQVAVKTIYGIELIDGGQEVKEVTTEEVMVFVARDIGPVESPTKEKDE